MGASPEPEQPIAPGTQTAPMDADGLLLDFVRDRDAVCPRCGYNVRNLTKPVCPECEEPLLLKVGGRTYPVRWLLATVAPGIFTGITAGVMAVIFLIVGLPPFVPLGAILTGSFLLASAAVAGAIILWSRRFVRQPQPRQVLWAVLLWVIHLCAFFLFLSYILLP
ncbi:MAG: hypothetical protein V3T84_05975 [Phycisphaerales bacterium]